jgi:flagella basal body P-ring formation protein FlgA
MKTIRVIKIFGLFLISASSAVFGVGPGLRIYLPREVQVEGRDVTVGDVAVVRGEPNVVEKAQAINLGKLTMSGQDIVISRAMLLGRLAGSGIETSDVEITGAQKVVVTQSRQVIRAEKITEEAESFLKKNFPDKSVCRYELIGSVDDFVLPVEVKKVELQPSLAADGERDRIKVNIAVIADGKVAGFSEVKFRRNYFCRQAVALRDIQPGEIITKDNVKVTQEVSRTAEPSDWQVPYGLAAKRPIKADSLVTTGMVGPVQREVLVRRNRHVAVIFERPGLSVTAIGKAMEDGRAGDYIKVRMQIKDSPRIIYAKVKENGTVEPLM